MTRKAQSALEYLMTYGWAILIIVIVGAALFALGVFNPAGSTALQVRGISNFQIDDALLVPNGNLTLSLGVKTGRSTNVTDIDFGVQGLSCENTDDSADVVISPSQTSLIVLDPDSACGLTVGDQVMVDMNITYQAGRSSITHTDTGSITITVQE